jgi:uncharacterized protein (DUF2126 family)/transglutaminase-like putative cysteine protease
MTIRVAIHHKTRYRFDRLVNLSPHIFRLRPAVHSRTPICAYSFKIQPESHFINWQQDPSGNFQARVVFPEKTKLLEVTVEVIADLNTINPFDFFIEEGSEHYPFKYAPEMAKELEPYLEIKEDGPCLKNWLKQYGRPVKKPMVPFLVDLNRQIFETVAYNIRLEPGVQSCEQTLTKRSGSCRDSTWLLVQVLRHMGLAARFVSGYLVQLKSDVKALDGPSGPEQDFTDLHAWAEVYVPGAGWIGLDPTSGLFAAEGHIPLACAANPASAAPVTGTTDYCETVFEFSNTVTRLHETPRVTKPYHESQWQRIDAFGEKVEEQLQEQDVRLTMGGEPTFVSVDDMESAEWNTKADGPLKQKLSYDLLLRLKNVFSQGALLHFGQGKWYPGEPLPRWQYSCYWRKDGQPCWQNPDLLADIHTDYQFNIKTGRAFVEKLVQFLQLPAHYIRPAYEDSLYTLWQEGRIPSDLDPLQSRMEDSLERQRLAQILQNLNDPVGFVLPLQWDWSQQSWQSGPWEFRNQHLFLLPGTSPIGMRLPLDSLPWVVQEDKELIEPQSLFDDLPELGHYHDDSGKSKPTPSDKKTIPVDVSVPHTALAIEIREGRLYVFMPPVTALEHYLQLLAAIESVAAELKTPVVIEGYEPPADYRLQQFKVTPDPGVIEVNIHPSRNWQELKDKTRILYEQAYQVRLGTEKFMLDGRHSGTGGGNHMTIGGETPSDSPLLRKPDLLRSLLTYWQHHPGLSYLFSGLFIGPTSQAPRVDEGRDEKLYELEIAFEQMPEGEILQPWLVDRLLRHLLTDVTGNTHRSEFCIDKLYSPDSSQGRLGILELRAFEMPPHWQMSLVQNVLLRALISRFWQQPYRAKLVRWGTRLHDQFLLPHFIRQDMAQVVSELQDSGFAFELDWLEPFFEFRFPLYGSAVINGMELEIRSAIEPWHVLGEEMVSGGTARLVDSSVERLQFKISGFVAERYIVTCNGRRLPLQKTDCQGEYVAGVRYRAWQLQSALHPTIPAHAPLVFDIYDIWNERSIGGVTYHVAHPGGRNYERFPVNSYEAEARRMNRFWNYGHTPAASTSVPRHDPVWLASNLNPNEAGKATFKVHRVMKDGPLPEVEPLNPEYPSTLDLRIRSAGQS